MENSEDWIKLIKGRTKCLYVLQVDKRQPIADLTVMPMTPNSNQHGKKDLKFIS